MKKALFRFYEELNDFLPLRKRKRDIEFHFTGKPSVKDVIESFGIPHTEVDLILVNSNPINFDYNIRDGDLISVYPVFESLDIRSVQHLRPAPLRNPRFIADVHLGKLTSMMRMLGFDTFYNNKLSDEEIIRLSVSENRTILTRDKKLLMNKEVTRGYYVRNTDPVKQITEVIRRFSLKEQINEFSRCMRCNSLLVMIEKEWIVHKLPQKVIEQQSHFFICKECDNVCWKGSHWRKMKDLICSLRDSV